MYFIIDHNISRNNSFNRIAKHINKIDNDMKFLIKCDM